MRRIEAVTGTNVLAYYGEKDALIADAAAAMKCPNPNDIDKKAASLMAELAAAKKEIEALNTKLAKTQMTSIISGAEQVGSVKLATAALEGMDSNVARSLGEEIKAAYADTVAVLAVNTDGRLNFIAVAGADAVKAGAHAGKIVSAVAAVTGGKGGGRPESAMAGGRDASKIADALSAAKEALSQMLL